MSTKKKRGGKEERTQLRERRDEGFLKKKWRGTKMGCQLGKCALTIPTYFIHRKITHVSFPRLLFAHFQVAYFGIKNLATSHLHTKSESLKKIRSLFSFYSICKGFFFILRRFALSDRILLTFCFILIPPHFFYPRIYSSHGFVHGALASHLKNK